MTIQRTEGQGKEPEHTHPAITHTHDHYHVSHHHKDGVLGEWEHRSYWHTHAHNHAPLTHSHDYDQSEEEQQEILRDLRSGALDAIVCRMVGRTAKSLLRRPDGTVVEGEIVLVE